MIALSPEQLSILALPGSILVKAGAGTGKTALCKAKSARVSSALVITRTTAAEEEFRSRAPGVRCHTIHGFCYEELGYPFIRNNNFEGLLDQYLLSKPHTSFDWLILEEIQDLSKKMAQVIRHIPHSNVFAVGDFNQQIYTWAGALAEPSEYLPPTYTTVSLKESYRISPSVCEELVRIIPGLDLIPLGPGKLTNKIGILVRTKKEVRSLCELFCGTKIRHTSYISDIEDKVLYSSSSNTPFEIRTIHSSKGKEYDIVLVKKFSGMEHTERNLTYVAYSRARKEIGTISADTNWGRIADWIASM